MTRETAKRKIRGFPLQRQAIAKKDIENRDYITTELVPIFEIESGYYQMQVNYKIRLEDGYIYGKAPCLDDFVKMQYEDGKKPFWYLTKVPVDATLLSHENVELLV